MAYKWNPTGQFYIGLNTDSRPTSADIGALLYEINLTDAVRKIYQTYNGGVNCTWTEISDDSLGSTNNPATVSLTGSNMDLRGKAADKPLATAVTIGATYWSVDTDPGAAAIEVSDGTNWVVM